jgi:hypothetical protein
MNVGARWPGSALTDMRRPAGETGDWLAVKSAQFRQIHHQSGRPAGRVKPQSRLIKSPQKDRPPQDRPPQDRPPQDRPPQDRPPQDRPPQDRASQDRASWRGWPPQGRKLRP